MKKVNELRYGVLKCYVKGVEIYSVQRQRKELKGLMEGAVIT